MKTRIRIILFIVSVGLAGWAQADEVNPTVIEATKADLSDSLKESAPIIVWNRQIAVLRTPYKDSTAADRAEEAIKRIEALAVRSDWEIKAIDVTAADGQRGVLISADTMILFAILEEDLDPSTGISLPKTAQAAADKLKAVLDEHAAQLKWSNLGRSIGFTAAATLIYILVVWIISKVRNIAAAKLEKHLGRFRRSLIVAGINLIPILIFLNRIAFKLINMVVVIAVTYLWATFCFAQFFFTQPWSEQLGEYLLQFLKSTALGIVEAIPGLITAILIFYVARVASSAVFRFFGSIETGYISVGWLKPASARASRRIAIAILWIFALTLAYPFIPGSESTAFKGISVFVGLLISLGSTGFINHLMSGLVIAFSGAMRVGDFVSINGIVGEVLELGTMSTKIATPKKEFITIPNGIAISGHITNYTELAQKDGAMISTTVTIGYDTPWRQVHALLILAAEKTDGIRSLPAPFVMQQALSDFYAEYELRAYIEKPEKRFHILSALHASIQDAFNDAGVQIMSPNFVSQPENAVVVPKSQWYAAPAVAPDNPEKHDG